MNQKPEIQYIGQFYVYGSEAREAALKAKKAKVQLPKPKLNKIQKIYIDPVAMLGILAAVVVLVVMVAGSIQLKSTWDQYNLMNKYLTQTRQKSAMVEHAYRTSFDPEQVRSAAAAMGMIPVEEAEVRHIRITMPQPKAKPTACDNLKWFLRGLVD